MSNSKFYKAEFRSLEYIRVVFGMANELVAGVTDQRKIEIAGFFEMLKEREFQWLVFSVIKTLESLRKSGEIDPDPENPADEITGLRPTDKGYTEEP